MNPADKHNPITRKLVRGKRAAGFFREAAGVLLEPLERRGCCYAFREVCRRHTGVLQAFSRPMPRADDFADYFEPIVHAGYWWPRITSFGRGRINFARFKNRVEPRLIALCFFAAMLENP